MYIMENCSLFGKKIKSNEKKMYIMNFFFFLFGNFSFFNFLTFFFNI